MIWRVLIASVLLTGCKACVSLDLPLDFPCNPDASVPTNECTQGFRCGLEGQCHMLDAGADYECRTNADCEGPWRCGLEGRCHALDAGAAYLCASDNDCEAMWRCGPAGLCVDATLEGLEVPDAGFTDATVRALFANMPSGAGAIGGSPSAQFNIANDAGCNIQLHVRSQSWMNGDVLTRHLYYSDGWAAITPGVLASSQACNDLEHVSINGPRGQDVSIADPGVIAIADGPRTTTTLSSTGLLCQFSLADDLFTPLPLTCVTPFSGGLPTHVKTVEDDARLIAWNDTQLWWLDSVDAPAFGPFSVTSLDGGVAAVRDVLGFALDPMVPGTGVLVAADDAIYSSLIDGGRLISRDGTASPFSPNLNMPIGNPGQGDGRTLAGGDGTLWVGLGYNAYVMTSAAALMSSPNHIMFDEVSGAVYAYAEPALTCDVDTRYANLSLNPVRVNNELGALSRCSKVPDAGARPAVGEAVQLSIVDPSNNAVVTHLGTIDDPTVPAPATFFEVPVRAGIGNAQTVVWADAIGHFWYGTSNDTDTSIGVVPQFPDGPFTNIGGDSTSLHVSTGEFDLNGEKSDNIGTAVVTRNSWRVYPDGGYEEGFRVAGTGSLGAVRGLPTSDIITFPAGILQRNIFIADQNLSVFLASTADTDTVLPPLDVSVFSHGGTQYLLWRSFDTLWLVAPAPGDAGFSIDDITAAAEPVRRMTPLSNGAITSLAGRDVSDGGFFEGYVVAGDRLFSVAAPNERVWRTEEVLVGSDEPVEVFFDRGRARIALRDGSLWSLPSRVQIAPSFDSSVGLALGFGFACQNVVALTTSDVYRLTYSPGQGLGAWTKLSLPPEVAAASQSTGAPLAGSSMQTLDKDVLLTLGNGMTFRLSFVGCP